MRRLLLSFSALLLAACYSSPTSPRQRTCTFNDLELNGVVVGQVEVCRIAK